MRCSGLAAQYAFLKLTVTDVALSLFLQVHSFKHSVACALVFKLGSLYQTRSIAIPLHRFSPRQMGCNDKGQHQTSMFRETAILFLRVAVDLALATFAMAIATSFVPEFGRSGIFLNGMGSSTTALILCKFGCSEGWRLRIFFLSLSNLKKKTLIAHTFEVPCVCVTTPPSPIGLEFSGKNASILLDDDSFMLIKLLTSLTD